MKFENALTEDAATSEDLVFANAWREHAVSTVRAIIFLGLIYGRALWLTLFSLRGSAPSRSFSRRAGSSSQSERDSPPPVA